LPAAKRAVPALEQVQAARPRTPRHERSYAYAGAASGVKIDLGQHGSGNGNGSGKKGDSKDDEYESF
jgi:hypothetical protein